MEIALLGYGKMGHEIEKIAVERGHHIGLIIDADNPGDLNVKNLKRVDAAIDFSTPDSAFGNIMACFSAGTPVVCGTTGWLARFDEVKKICLEQGNTFFYASNYSLGVNLFFALNRYLAQLMNTAEGYRVSVTEIHHVHKLDAPSGTALSLAKDLVEKRNGITGWTLGDTDDPALLPIHAIREGEVPGTHVVTYDSGVDTLEISHRAKSRKGFAQGAVLAAEFIRNRKGVYSMADLLGL
jgi:4-hydroxy-tetrahydrodipicolinate reductase